MKTYLAVDPGGVTGVARLTQNDYGLLRFDTWEVEGGRLAFYEWFDGYPKVDRLFVEDFIISTGTVKKTQQVDPWRIVGFLEGWAYQNEVPLWLQAPATAKRFATDAKLKHFGWHRPSKGGHANDAARHLLLGLRDQAWVGEQLLALAETL